MLPPAACCCRFIDAAGRYYELSSITARTVGGLALGEVDLIGEHSNCCFLAPLQLHWVSVQSNPSHCNLQVKDMMV
jgi:hypothetical protein